jgi:hypothetical protein
MSAHLLSPTIAQLPHEGNALITDGVRLFLPEWKHRENWPLYACIIFAFVSHVLLLLLLKKVDLLPGDNAQQPGPPLSVRLNNPAASTQPPPQPASEKPVTPTPPVAQTLPTPPRPQKPQQQSAVVVAQSPLSVPVTPQPPEPSPTPSPEVTPQPPQKTEPTDMAAMIEARRAQRQAMQGTTASERQDAARDASKQAVDANAANNLAAAMAGRAGPSGVFQILHKGQRMAQFSFNGWAKDSRGKWREVIEVDAGTGGDVERAIVRRMIALIRTHYQGNFNWDSHRLQRVVTLSARVEDNAGLEEFMIKEFFGGPQQ